MYASWTKNALHHSGRNTHNPWIPWCQTRRHVTSCLNHNTQLNHHPGNNTPITPLLHRHHLRLRLRHNINTTTHPQADAMVSEETATPRGGVAHDRRPQPPNNTTNLEQPNHLWMPPIPITMPQMRHPSHRRTSRPQQEGGEVSSSGSPNPN